MDHSTQTEIKRSDFDKDFIFGAATSAYQIEGAWNVGGKGKSNWDCFTQRTPAGTKDGNNGCVAIDHYNRLKEDVALMKKVGVDSYRFSIAWVRILPGGRLCDGICKDGVKFYNDLIDALVAEEIEPCATLFHWDVPQHLEDEYGGFLNNQIVKHFSEFAEVCFWEFGDRVKKWITLNEPWSFTYNGYVTTDFPPCHGIKVIKSKQDICREILPKQQMRRGANVQNITRELLSRRDSEKDEDEEDEDITEEDEDEEDEDITEEDEDEEDEDITEEDQDVPWVQSFQGTNQNILRARDISQEANVEDMARELQRRTPTVFHRSAGTVPQQADDEDLARELQRRTPTVFHRSAGTVPQQADDEDLARELQRRTPTVFHRSAGTVPEEETDTEPILMTRHMARDLADTAKDTAPKIIVKGNPSTEPYIVAHNLILAHASAVAIYRKKYQKHQGGKIGMTNVAVWFYPFRRNNSQDKKAVLRAVDFILGWFVAPLVTGDYPASMRKIVGRRLPKFQKEEVELVKGSYDFLGINYYTTYYAKNQSRNKKLRPNYNNDKQVEYIMKRDGEWIGPQAGSEWLFIVPEGIYHLMLHVKETYNNPDIYITENGVDEKNDKTKTISEACKDETRIQYHKDHLKWLKHAIDQGVRLKGYFLWSLFDNFEWAEGYTVRFGIFYVDLVNGNLTRFPKDSAMWWMNFLNKQEHSAKRWMNFLQEVIWKNNLTLKQPQDEATVGKPAPAVERPTTSKICDVDRCE